MKPPEKLLNGGIQRASANTLRCREQDMPRAGMEALSTSFPILHPVHFFHLAIPELYLYPL